MDMPKGPKGDKPPRISPAWLATEAMAEIGASRNYNEVWYFAAHLRFQQIARSFCSRKFDPLEESEETSDELRNEAEALRKHADALETWGRHLFDDEQADQPARRGISPPDPGLFCRPAHRSSTSPLNRPLHECLEPLEREAQAALATKDHEADSLGEQLIADVKVAFGDWIAEHPDTTKHEVTELVRRHEQPHAPRQPGLTRR